MKFRKGLISLLIITAIMIILGSISPVFGEIITPKYLGIEEYYISSGYGYKASGKQVWKVTSYSDNSGTRPNQSTTYYCIRAGVGFGTNRYGESSGTNQIKNYNKKFDFKNYNSIDTIYKSVIPSGGDYNSLVWLLEHCYVPEIDTAGTYKNQLLTAALGTTNTELTDNDIDVIQQRAIWHFTNKTDANYNSYVELQLKNKTSDPSYRPISDFSWDRADDAESLYTYLVDSATANSGTTPVSSNNTNPISLNSSNAEITLEGTNYILGPYTINRQVNNIDYTLSSTLKNGSTPVTYTILDSNKNTTQLANVVGSQFYISVPKNSYASGLTFTVTTNTNETVINYWMPTCSNAEQAADEQPVVEIKKEPKSYEIPVITPSIPQEKVFDLSLRKFITSVDGVELRNTTTGKYIKEPIVDLTPLVNKTSTTAIYKHAKYPVSVRTGNEVIYTIRVYNEGEKDGYVTQITDHLPPQLEYVNDSFNTSRGWTCTDGRNAVANISSPRLLTAFNGTTLDYVDIQIKCRVKSNVDSGTIITNIADITGFTDSNGNTVTDRDSQKSNVNLPTDSNFPSYKGKDTNKNDLTDNNYYYEGQQDDDDFDKLVVKSFDLALRKFIIKINDNIVGTQQNGTVTYSREPQITQAQISALYNGQTQTAEKTHPKNPLKVSTGDVVTYIIRVYNEGSINGKATQVTDILPAGLQFKTDSSVNTTYGWTNPSGDGKTIITTKLNNRVLNAVTNNTIDYEDLQIECIVVAEEGTANVNLKNVAEITAQTDENGNQITDRDSTPNNLSNPQKVNYNPGTSTRGWGYEDDDDYEELILPAKEFDLSLRKFITKVNDRDLIENGKYIKEPIVDVTPLVNLSDTTAIYKHQKAPVGVSVGDEVIYTIRVYNEGGLDGYVTEITDHLPKELEFVNDEFNAKYGWTVSSDGKEVKTNITSPYTLYSANRDEIYNDRTQETDKVLLKAFRNELDYIDVKIKCKVISVTDMNQIITNIADITGFVDGNGNDITDRDSQKDNVTVPSDSDLPDYKGNTSNKSILTDKDYFYKGQQDDDDFDKLIIQEFDLALRKFITGVNETRVTNRYPQFTTEIDENGNYIYRHTKEPVLVESSDLVEYTIRIFNEGDIAGYAKVVKDDIPEGLEFIPDNELNVEYRWKMLDENGEETTDSKQAKYIVTDYLSKEQEIETGRDNLIGEFDKTVMAQPDYKDVKAVFKVIAKNTYGGIITNTAEIAEDADENGNPIDDRDSTPNNNNPKEDDIDVEHIKLRYFDLALRKFITGVNDKEVKDRYPVFKVTDDGKYVYEHTKEPVDVLNGDIVYYTIRVYNEGTISGYAESVKDDLPEGLLYLPNNEVNKEYRWKMLDENGEETTDVSKAVSIVTDYLSKEQEESTERHNLITKFNPDRMEEPDHRDLKIAFKVTEPNTSDRILINKAQISDDADENGNEVTDIDSIPDKWNEGEDDQDIEKVKVRYFDLALRKWVTQAIVIEDGKEKITNTGHKPEDDPEQVVKVEIVKSKINKVVVKFKYSIRITNQGEIAGYATEISDYIPEGLKFVAADNPDWKEVDGKIITNKLADTLLQPGESADVEVILTWINGANNMGLKVNVAEISKDKNDSNTPDIDSTPNNKKEGEDDIDDAPVILATKTGGATAIPYVVLTIVSLSIISVGVIGIKKYIL